jgi:hypothetical protein
MSIKLISEISVLTSNDLINLFDESDFIADMDCSICCEEIECHDLRITKCGHSFHINCINEWTKIKSNCPMCRTVLFNDYKILYDIIHRELNISYYVNHETYRESFNNLIDLLKEFDLEDNDNTRYLLKQILICRATGIEKHTDNMSEWIKYINLINQNYENFEWLMSQIEKLE